MITAIEIENFKAIGSPGVRLELRPITLLFGPNSSGKSTIIQALQYLRHAVLYNEADVDRTDRVTGELDLGGFRRLVHGHDLDQAIRIRIEFEWEGWLEPNLFEVFGEDRMLSAEKGPINDLLAGYLDSLAMEIEVRWSRLHGRPFFNAYRVFICGVKAAEVRGDADSNFIVIEAAKFEEAIFGGKFPPVDEDGSIREFLQVIDEHCKSSSKTPRFRVIPDPRSRQFDWVSPSEEGIDGYGPDHALLLSALMIGPSFLVERELRNLCYIGPIRDIPPRHLHEIAADKGLPWNQGIAAWNLLFRRGRQFVEDVSKWLSGHDRLDTGYGVRVQTMVEMADDVLFVRLLEGEEAGITEALAQKILTASRRKRIVFTEEETGLELSPSEVGTGLSQVLPIVVAAIDPVQRFVAIEQPELHVHPAVQVGLGDLFIQGIQPYSDELNEFAQDSPRIFLIETHSEHLMLRLLRRIEETAAGDLPPGIAPLKSNQISVNYLDKAEGTSNLKITPLRVDETGEFIDRWPKGFFDERGDELFR